MKNLKKFSKFLFLVIAICVAPLVVPICGEVKAEGATVMYQSPIFEDGALTSFTEKTVEATPITNTSFILGSFGSTADFWYVVNESIEVSQLIPCENVHLILMDGATLTVTKGICVAAAYGNLTIYSQSQGDNAGKLIATGENMAAAIGSTSSTGASGVITINGGNIQATGGTESSGIGGGGFRNAGTVIINAGNVEAIAGSNASGIGGGSSGTGTVTINGGNIQATGCSTNGAGIGGGSSGTGTVTINGGDVQAFGTTNGAGIGGGSQGTGEIIITGGKITATGGTNSAGIGGGNLGAGTVTINGGDIQASGTTNGAGIGGGSSCTGTVTINGGNIQATGGTNSAGIGGGSSGTGIVTITGGNIQATGITSGAGIGGGSLGAGTVVIKGGYILASGSTSAPAIGSGGMVTTHNVTIESPYHYGYSSESFDSITDYTLGNDTAITESLGKYVKVMYLLDIEKVKNASYPLPSEEIYTDKEKYEAYIKDIATKAMNDENVTISVEQTSAAPAIDCSKYDEVGTEGEYVFLITISNNGNSESTEITTQSSPKPYVPQLYAVTDGDKQVITEKENTLLSIKIDAEFAKFETLSMNGVLVDNSNYTKEEGSVILTLKDDFVTSLESGNYVFIADFTDGSASFEMEVEKKIVIAPDPETEVTPEPETEVTPEPEIESLPTVNSTPTAVVVAPETGDTNMVALYVSLMLLSVCIIGITLFINRRNTIKSKS